RSDAHAPRGVAGSDHVGVAGADPDGRPIRVLSGESPRRHRSDVVPLTPLGPRHGLDALRPPPPRLQGHSTHLHGAEIDDFDLCLVGSPTLVRGVEALRGDPCHLVLPRSPTLELNILARHHYSVQHEPVNARTSPNAHGPLKGGALSVARARIASLLSWVARPCSARRISSSRCARKPAGVVTRPTSRFVCCAAIGAISASIRP